MARIPIYTAQRSLDTDRGGMPRVQANDHRGGALQGLGRSIASLPFGAGQRASDENQPQLRQQQRRQAQQNFGKVRAVADTQTALKQGFVKHLEAITPDGAGFYDTYKREVVEPAIDKAVAMFSPEEQPAVRDVILARAEPVLQRAAETEREQSAGFYEAETDRLAAGILDDVDPSPQSFTDARERLGELINLSVLPKERARQKAAEFDRELAWTAASRIAGNEPEQLLDGMLGFQSPAGGGEGGSTALTKSGDVARSLTGGDEDAARIVERFMMKAFGQSRSAGEAGEAAVTTAAFLAPGRPYQLGDWATATTKPRRGDLVLLPDGGIGLFDRAADGGRSLVLIANRGGVPALESYDRQALEFRRVSKIPPEDFARMAETSRMAFGLNEAMTVTEPDPRFLGLSFADRLALIAEVAWLTREPLPSDSGFDAPQLVEDEADDGWVVLDDGRRIRRIR